MALPDALSLFALLTVFEDWQLCVGFETLLLQHPALRSLRLGRRPRPSQRKGTAAGKSARIVKSFCDSILSLEN